MLTLRNKKAFTLVEIMIVIAVVAILAIIAVPNFLRSRLSANQSSARATLRTVGTALESYAGDYRTYPNDTNLLISDQPEYLTKDYFDGASHGGYTFTATTLGDYDYVIDANPFSSSTGEKNFQLTTGSVLTEVP